MASLFDFEEEARRNRDMLGKSAKVTPQMIADAPNVEAAQSLLPVPLSPIEKMIERDGKAKTFGKMLLGGFTGLTPFLMPELIGGRERHQAELALYYKQQAAQAERDRMSGLGSGLRDAFGTETLDDDMEAAMAARAGGWDLADIKHFQNMAGHSYQDPSWETKFDNGVLVRYDVNGNAPAQPVLGDDGGFITEKMDGDMRKTAGWFKRAVPALENMHKLEDRGVDISRETLTLLAQAAQNEDGIIVPQLFNQALNELKLDEDQRQYIRNARDLAMIQLRKESGAAIGVSEMFNELEQNLMLDDYSPEGYEYQRGSRNRKYRALAEGMPSYLIDEFKADGYFDTLDNLRKNGARRDPSVWDGERTDFSRFKEDDFIKIWDQLPPGDYVSFKGDRVRKPARGESVFGRKR